MSVVVPVYRDDEALDALTRSLPHDPRLEVIIAAPPPLGRGAQMNAGARRASGVWLLFVHADSRLPHGWLDALAGATRDSRVCGGWFRFAIAADAWQARVIERLVHLRVRMFRLPYGDQAIFVRRDVFASLGGYREWPLMEDVDFIQRLVLVGPVVELPLAVSTSPRRWHRDGWFRRSARNLAILSLFLVGVSTTKLARLYDP